MTVVARSHCVPSEVEPAALAELIADARQIVLPGHRPARQVIDLTGLPQQRRVVAIPELSVTLVAGYAEYGC